MREQISSALSALFDCVDRINQSDNLTNQQQEDLLTIKSLGKDLYNYFIDFESEIDKQSANDNQSANPTNKAMTDENGEEVYALLALMFTRLRQSINLDDLLDNVALEIFEILQSDQVIMHQLTDQDLQLIEHEFANQPERSLLGKPIPSIYTDPQWLERYQTCISQVVQANEVSDSNIYKSLKALDIYSAIVVAIPSHKKLWGLLIVHQYSSNHTWQTWEIELLEKLGTQLAITIHQMELLTKSENLKVERDQVIAELHHNQSHDLLTNLPNRESFMKSLDLAFATLQADPNRDFAVLFIDCDRFKSINDNFGAAVGDQLLQEISKRLAMYSNHATAIARIDSDEFAILVEDIDRGSLGKENFIVHLTNQILDSIKQPFLIDSYQISTSISIGIAISNLEYIAPNKMLSDANVAMHYSRSFGRGKQAIFRSSMNQEIKVRWQLESDLTQAIGCKQFYLVYQPIVSLHKHDLSGFEVLLRWLHPVQGLISPQEFLPIAEETGLIIQIGYWVLETACKQLSIWQQEFPDIALTIGINVSTLQVVQPDFVQRIEEIIAQNQIAPNLIKLEITETMLMNNIEVSSHKLEQLRQIGVQVYIDDFGTGYSSFSYLQNLPIDVLKIDRSFTNRVSTDVKSRRIIQSILRLANNLGMGIVVEGIETSEEADYFEAMGGSSIELQGYFISRPLDKDKATAWIQSSQNQ